MTENFNARNRTDIPNNRPDVASHMDVGREFPEIGAIRIVVLTPIGELDGVDKIEK